METPHTKFSIPPLPAGQERLAFRGELEGGRRVVVKALRPERGKGPGGLRRRRAGAGPGRAPCGGVLRPWRPRRMHRILCILMLPSRVNSLLEESLSTC